jgi:hypothetical protein
LQGLSAGNPSTTSTSGIPAGIIALPSGTLVRGQVVQVAGNGGIVVLRTPKGDLSLKTDLPISRGNEMVIRLETISAGLRARIISVDGLTPQELETSLPPRVIPTVTSQISSELPELLPNLPNATAAASLATGGKMPAALPTVVDSTPWEGANSLPSALSTVMDTVEIAPPPQNTLLRAALLSRSPDLPQLLPQLPATIRLSSQRLEAGAVISVRLLSDTIQMPKMQPSSTALPMPPATATTPATQPPLPSSQTTAPLQTPTQTVTTPSPPVAPFLSTGAISAPAPSPHAPTTATSLVLAELPTTQNVPQSPPTSPALAMLLASETPDTPSLVNAGDSPTPAIPESETATQTVRFFPVPPRGGKSAATSVTPLPVTSPTLAAPTPTATVSPAITNPTAPLTPALPALENDAALLAQGIISAQVIGTEQSGETVLKTPIGVLKLDLLLPHGHRLTLPHDAVMNLQLVAMENSPSLASDSLQPLAKLALPATLAELSEQWHSLRDAVTLLQQTHPQLAQHLLQNVIPQPHSKLARDVFLFMVGLGSGDVSQWLGKETLEALEQNNRGDIIRKLSSEFATLRQFYVDSPNPNWQAVIIPLQHQGEWQQARLFIKKDPPKSSQPVGEESSATRFIMELSLSRLGTMQLDGFIRKHPKDTLFDLVVRSSVALPAQDQDAIRTIFTDAAAMTGFKGGISFQIGHPFPTLPLEELLKSDRNVIA